LERPWPAPSSDSEESASSPSVSPPASWRPRRVRRLRRSGVLQRARRPSGPRPAAEKAPALAEAAATAKEATAAAQAAEQANAAQAVQPAVKRVRLTSKAPDPSTLPRSVPRRGSELVAERCGLEARHYRRMRALRLPKLFFQLLAAALVPNAPRLKCVEYFSGVETVVSAFREKGMLATPYDINRNHVDEDLTNPAGFWHALRLASQLDTGHALGWFATVCSTWVWVSRSSTGRTSENVYGNTALQCVRLANLMVTRTTILAIYMMCRNIRWMLEQPSSSLMEKHKRMLFLRSVGQAPPFQAAAWASIFTWIGAFGGHVAKPTRLYGNCAVCLNSLKRERPDLTLFRAQSDGVYSVDINAAGKKTVSGGPGLKATQHYPESFGRAVQQAFAEAPTFQNDDVDNVETDSDDDSEDSWASADLEAVAEYARALPP